MRWEKELEKGWDGRKRERRCRGDRRGEEGWVMLGDSLLMILMLRCGRRAGVQANEWAQLA
jgi:hypothetical protein